MPWSCEVHALTGWLLDYLSEKTLDAKSCLDVLELPRFQFIPWLLCSFWLYVRFVSFVQQSLLVPPALADVHPGVLWALSALLEAATILRRLLDAGLFLGSATLQ